jgi:hypothetical protein
MSDKEKVVVQRQIDGRFEAGIESIVIIPMRSIMHRIKNL